MMVRPESRGSIGATEQNAPPEARRVSPGGEVRIVRAGREDAAEFYRLEARCFEMDGNGVGTLYYWVPILSHQCCYKAVLVSSRIVGGVVSMPTFDKQWYINSLFVDPAYRRRGIAKMLMEKVFASAWHDEVVLYVKTNRPHLTRFYMSLGFELQGRSPDHYMDGEDRFIMAKKVGSGGERTRWAKRDTT